MRHKSREQYPPPAYNNRLDTLASRLHKRVQKGNRAVGAIVLSPTDAASQEAVVGLAQRVVVARARALRDAAVQYCLEYLGAERPDFELERSARSALQFAGVFPEAALSGAYAPVDLDGQVSVVVVVPPEVSELVRLVEIWSAASTLKMAVDSGIPFVPKHMIPVLASDTVRPNAAHTTTITPIIFLSCSDICETTPASSK